MKRFMFAVLATATAVVAIGGSAGAASVPPAPNGFGESIDVRVVNVDAVVTNRKGDRVKGLTAKDFRLLVDGREVPIDYFTEISSGQAAQAPAGETKAPAAAATAPGLPAAGAAPAAIAAPGEAVGINYLVYIDDQFSIKARRNLVLQKLAASLGRLGPNDQMALVSFNGHKLTRLNEWTGDHKALEAVFAAAEKRSTSGLMALAQMDSEGDASQMVEESGPGVVTMGWGIDIGMRAVVAAMRGTPAPPGRKVMLFLNGGWGFPDLTESATAAPTAFNQPQAARIFSSVFDTANLLGYTLYAIEVPGPMTRNRSNDARVMGAPGTGNPAMEELGRMDVISAGTMRPSDGFISSGFGLSLHENLEVIARQTGGKAILNSAWQNALERVTDDTGSYYWLGFTPQWKADGSHHDIHLEVRQPGLTARSRSGFSDLTRETEAQVQAESLLLYGPPKSVHTLAVTAGVLRRVSFLRRELPVTVEVPADALAPQAGEGNWDLVGTLSIATLEKSGSDPRWRTVAVHFKSASLPPAGATTSVQTVLKLPRSTRRVVFAVGGEHGEVRAWKLLDLKSVERE